MADFKYVAIKIKLCFNFAKTALFYDKILFKWALFLFEWLFYFILWQNRASRVLPDVGANENWIELGFGAKLPSGYKNIKA